MALKNVLRGVRLAHEKSTEARDDVSNVSEVTSSSSGSSNSSDEVECLRRRDFGLGCEVAFFLVCDPVRRAGEDPALFGQTW